MFSLTIFSLGSGDDRAFIPFPRWPITMNLDDWDDPLVPSETGRQHLLLDPRRRRAGEGEREEGEAPCRYHWDE